MTNPQAPQPSGNEDPNHGLPPMQAALVRLCGRHRLLLRETVGRLLRPGEETIEARQQRITLAGSVLARLAQKGFLNHHRPGNLHFPPLPGDVPYFTLTEQGASFSGVAKERAIVPGKRGFGSAALNNHLALHWYCCRGDQTRYRLEARELEPLLGNHASFRNTPYCLSHTGKAWRIERVYIASGATERVVEELRRQHESQSSHPAWQEWQSARALGITVLAQEPSACADIKRRVQQDETLRQALINVYVAPSVLTLLDELESP